MKIVSVKEVQQEKDILHVARREITSADCRIGVEGLVPSAANGETELCRESYQPSTEGLSALLKVNKAEDIFSVKKEKEKDSSEDEIRALKIAQNIMRGKIVPPQDEQFLIEHNDKLYQAAKNIASMKEQTEKVKSELEEDEDTVMKLMKEILSGEGRNGADCVTISEAGGAESQAQVSSSEEDA